MNSVQGSGVHYACSEGVRNNAWSAWGMYCMKCRGTFWTKSRGQEYNNVQCAGVCNAQSAGFRSMSRTDSRGT